MAKMIERPNTPASPKSVGPSFGPGTESDGPKADSPDVELKCTHGAHKRTMVFRKGTTIAEARKVLQTHLNIDPAAMAVLDGKQVGDEDVIGQHKQLYFVKQAAVKGGYAVEITDDSCVLKMDGKGRVDVDIPKFVKNIAGRGVTGMHEESNPDGTLWRVDQGDHTLLIIQLDPFRRAMRVARSGYGADAKYENMTLAHPYIILKLPFKGGRIQPQCELFYRNEPVRSIDDRLYFSNMLNVSPNAYGCKAWFCSQYLHAAVDQANPPKNPSQWAHVLIQHLWGAAMNRSSESHEGNSCFSMYEKNADNKYMRINNFDTWQACSLDDANFVFEIDWLDAGCTPRSLIDQSLKQHAKVRKIETAADLVTFAREAVRA